MGCRQIGLCPLSLAIHWFCKLGPSMGMFLVYLSVYKMSQLYQIAVKIINNQVILSRGPGIY